MKRYNGPTFKGILIFEERNRIIKQEYSSKLYYSFTLPSFVANVKAKDIEWNV